MDPSRNDLLGEVARDAALERSDFLVQATEQLDRFLKANRRHIEEIGGLVLIDEDPDYLSIAPDLSFRSRTRFLNEGTGEWESETEVIESPSELVELYNPADIYAAFADAARAEAGLPSEPTAAEDLLQTAGISVEESVVSDGPDPYQAAADEWAASRPDDSEPADELEAARRLYDLALVFQERSQETEAALLDEFAESARVLAPKLGDFVITDDDDERLVLEASGSFVAEVVPEDAEGEWRRLSSAEDLVEFYDPTDVFGDLADALAEAFPEVAPELTAEQATDREDHEDVEDAADDGDGQAAGPNGEDRSRS